MLFIQRIDFDFFAGLRVVRLDSTGAQALFLAVADKPLGLFGGVLLVVNVELLHQAFDGAELVLGVQNLERLRQIRQLVMRPQQTVAQAVEGANPHATHVDGQHGA